MSYTDAILDVWVAKFRFRQAPDVAFAAKMSKCIRQILADISVKPQLSDRIDSYLRGAFNMASSGDELYYKLIDNMYDANWFPIDPMITSTVLATFLPPKVFAKINMNTIVELTVEIYCRVYNAIDVWTDQSVSSKHMFVLRMYTQKYLQEGFE